MDYRKILNDLDIKYTKQREIILATIKQVDKPLSAEELFWLIKDVDDSISLATIYRSLALFNEKDLILKISDLSENILKYKYNKNDHSHHLVCLKCHKKIRLKKCPLISSEQNLENTYNFEIVQHSLEIFGYCQYCRWKNESFS